MILPPYVSKIINILNVHNREAFVVGGCVRDLLMDIEPSDYDIATSALPRRSWVGSRKQFQQALDTEQ